MLDFVYKIYDNKTKKYLKKVYMSQAGAVVCAHVDTVVDGEHVRVKYRDQNRFEVRKMELKFVEVVE